MHNVAHTSNYATGDKKREYALHYNMLPLDITKLSMSIEQDNSYVALFLLITR